MPKVSINILTRNRSIFLTAALSSLTKQNFKDFEVIVVNNGSTDDTQKVLVSFKNELPLNIISFPENIGITKARQEALLKSAGEYIAILDDDDEWVEADKLKKQTQFLDSHADYVLIGGGIKAGGKLRLRPESDPQIKSSMLLRNNFFTSTVMFRRDAAIKAGGFIYDGVDFAEDYDLWLRLGKKGKMYNFPQVFTAYTQTSYNKARFKDFLRKQLSLINREKASYPWFWLASLILKFRLII